ncbi:MAG: hypothetical protein RL059_282 [Bacteroidota bacterium]|jgi:hypothetical protein
MNIPPTPENRTLREEVEIIMGQLAKMKEADEEWQVTI